MVEMFSDSRMSADGENRAGDDRHPRLIARDRKNFIAVGTLKWYAIEMVCHRKRFLGPEVEALGGPQISRSKMR